MLGAGADRHRGQAQRRRGDLAAARWRWRASRTRRTSIRSSRWRTGARATLRKPISPPPRPRSRAATMKTARELAARAKTRFPTGSPGWVQADDIASMKQPRGSLFGSNNDSVHRRTQAMSHFRLPAAALALALIGRCPGSGAGLLPLAARVDREDHQGVPREAPRGAAGGDGGAREEAADGRTRKGPLRRSRTTPKRCSIRPTT